MPLTPNAAHTQAGPPTSGPPSVPPTSAAATSSQPSSLSQAGNVQLPGTSGSPAKASSGSIRDPVSVSVDLPSDLNFDPAAVIDGDAQGQEGLNVSTVILHMCPLFVGLCSS